MSKEHMKGVDTQPRSGFGSGLRYNEGKLRLDLVPIKAQEEYAKVLTKGAEKYEERNWERGMKWSNVLASLKRHVAAFEKGEDYDQETGLLHTAHIMCNAAFLTEYYSTYPEGDDRPHQYLRPKKIGLDIDEVLCDFVRGFSSKMHETKCVKEICVPDRYATFWNDPDINKYFDEIKDDESFWLNLPRKVDPNDLKFEPYCYITSRPIPSDVTKKWLHKNGFPDVPIYTIGRGQSKIDVALESGIDIFIDDRFENFVELNRAGVCTYLMDAAHNKRYKVGYKRITDISKFKL